MSDSSPPPPPPLTGAYIVGPLLVTNALSWALWGVLTTQLAFFVRDVRRRRKRAKSNLGGGNSEEKKERKQRLKGENERRFGFRRRRVTNEDTKTKIQSLSPFDIDDDNVNPWRKSFIPPPSSPTPPIPIPIQIAVPPIGAYPSQRHHGGPRARHERNRSSKSFPSSLDPYSPTAGHPSPLDTDSHSILLSKSKLNGIEVPGQPPCGLCLLFCTLYVLECVRTVLETAQFWRVSVRLWGKDLELEDLESWIGSVLADCIGPVVFIMTVGYFIYALYFSPFSLSSSSTIGGKRRSALRPLSIFNSKNKGINVLPDPYSFPQSPSSTVHSHANTNTNSRSRFGSATRSRWQSSSSMVTRLAEPVILAILAIVVGVCGFVDCARSLDGRPPGAPVQIDAISLIWFAGMLAVDVVLCVLLVRAVLTEGRMRHDSWVGRTLIVMGECGGAMVVVNFLALVLVLVWRGGKPPSTLPTVAPTLLPAIYANTVILHAQCLFSPFSLSSSSSRDFAGFGSNESRVIHGKGEGAKYEDIEMGLRNPVSNPPANRGTGGVAPGGAIQARVDLSAAAARGGESTFSTTESSGDGGAALRERALAYGREKEAMREREKEREVVRERDTFGSGSGSSGHLAVPTLSNPNANANSKANVGASAATIPGVANPTPALTETVTEKAKAPSVRSGVSGALSLELPTFRRGKGHAWKYRYASGHPGFGYGGYDYDEESDGEGSEEWDEDEIDLDSEEIDLGMGTGTGLWDYGFANAEREKERVAAAAAATLNVASATSTGNGSGSGSGEGVTKISVQGGGPGKRWQNLTLPSGLSSAYGQGKRNSFPSRPSSWRKSFHEVPGTDVRGEADEEDDKVSMLSGISTRSRRSAWRRRAGRHSFNAYANPTLNSNGGQGQGNPRMFRLLPRPPLSGPGAQQQQSLATASRASMSTDSIFLTGGALGPNSGSEPLMSPQGSVLVIGRGGLAREPSIAEGSVDRAASVAATRASTGSMWSTFSYRHPFGGAQDYREYSAYGGHASYPRPVQLPDLDVDLLNEDEGGRMRGRAEEGQGQNLGEALALGSLSVTGPSSIIASSARKDPPHPYSAAAGAGDGEGETEGGEGVNKRRWNVHPLKRIAEMGRLRF